MSKESRGGQAIEKGMNKSKVTIDQAKDTALALILILLLSMFFRKTDAYLLPAIGVLVLVMTWPSFFRGPARLWFGLSHVLGTIVSKILLTIIFVVVATPIGVVRGWRGSDPMRRRAWKKDALSVFVERNHTYMAEDIETPY